MDVIGDYISCRQILSIMMTFGFMIENILKVNLSLALVVMVMPQNSSVNSSLSHPDHWKTPTFVNTSQSNIYRLTMDDDNSQPIHSNLTIERLPKNKYDWNEYEVNFMLGAFFWGYVCTQLFGGRLTEIIGPKKVFGYSILIASFITFFTPLMTTLGYKAVSGLRVVLGLLLGPIWPSVLPLAAHWIPPTERSKFMSYLLAYALVTAAVIPICGFVIALAGWESVFYFTGGISFIWSIIWFIVIYDSPAQHPRISIKEKRIIEEAIGESVSSKRVHPIPWKSIITSAPVWAIIISNFGNIFGFCTITIQLPIYLKYILNYEIEENGVISALPYVGKYIVGLIAAIIADYLHRENKLSVTTIRKIFNSIGLFAPGISWILLSQFGSDQIIFISVMVLSMTLNGAISAGYLGNTLDFAPNFSGTITGISFTFSSVGCYISNVIVGNLTYNNQTFSQWSIIFWIVGGCYMFGGVIFLFFSTGNLQEWNFPDSKSVRDHTNIDKREDDEGAVFLE